MILYLYIKADPLRIYRSKTGGSGLALLSDTHLRSGGNVLFLILIAVALFAALSYAVTSSTRVGEDGISKEVDQIQIAQILQDCGTLRQSTERFLFSGKADTDIQMNVAGNPEAPCRTGANCLFAAEGGGAIIPIPPQRKGGKGGAPQLQMVYGFNSTAEGWFLAGYANDKPLVMMTVDNLTIPFCMALNKAVGLDEITYDISEESPNFREVCVVSGVSNLTFLCPLSR